jgi:hypothetical protein
MLCLTKFTLQYNITEKDIWVFNSALKTMKLNFFAWYYFIWIVYYKRWLLFSICYYVLIENFMGPYMLIQTENFIIYEVLFMFEFTFILKKCKIQFIITNQKFVHHRYTIVLNEHVHVTSQHHIHIVMESLSILIHLISLSRVRGCSMMIVHCLFHIILQNYLVVLKNDNRIYIHNH